MRDACTVLLRCWSGWVLVGLIAGCSSNTSTPPPPAPSSSPNAAAAPARASAMQPPSKPEDVTTLRGKLSFEEIPPVKSMRAYEGVEFRLKTASGEELPLTPGAVTRERLIQLHGKEVTLKTRLQQPRKPSPMEQAPVGPGGEPLARPARHEVLKILDGG